MINYDMWAEQAIGKVSGEKKLTLVEITLNSFAIRQSIHIIFKTSDRLARKRKGKTFLSKHVKYIYASMGIRTKPHPEITKHLGNSFLNNHPNTGPRRSQAASLHTSFQWERGKC